MDKKVKAWLRFYQAKKIGIPLKKIILAKLGNPENYAGTNSDLLENVNFLNKQQIVELTDNTDPDYYLQTMHLIEKFQMKFITIMDEDYPPLLKNISSPPFFLFVRGNIKASFSSRYFAVVGTRRPSNYGRQVAARLVQELAKAGLIIVSGMAYGIDTVAHRAALDVGGRTIAVLGTGCDTIYPSINKKLAQEIMENGALISEFLPGNNGAAHHFPRRNRIISGCCMGTLVVEGGIKSGSLITARLSANENREVFALPGDINREQSTGPNYLIQNGAKMVCSALDILEEFQLAQIDDQLEFFPELSPAETDIYAILMDNKPEMMFEELALTSSKNVAELSSILLTLELKSLVKREAGNRIIPCY